MIHKLLNLNITLKLVLFLLGVSVIPLLALGTISYNTARSVILDEVSNYALALVIDQQTYLELTLEAVESLIANISSVEDIKQVLDDEYDPDDSYTKLATHAKIGYILNGYINLKGLVSIDIFTNGGAHYHVGDTLNTERIDQVDLQRLYQEGLNSDRLVYWAGVEDNVNVNSTHEKVISAVKVFKVVDAETLQEKPVAVLIVNYSVDNLYNHFSQLDVGEDAFMMIIDDKNRLIYHPNKQAIGSKVRIEFSEQLAMDEGSFVTTIENEEMFVTYVRSPIHNWTLVSLVPFNNLTNSADTIWRTMISVLVICFAFISLTAFGLSKTVVTPINQITDLFKRIQAGTFNCDVRLPENRTDEIGELSRWFNTFLDSLDAKQRAEEELIQAKEAAEAANQAKSEFLANMSHELRTPLNGILGYAQVLTQDEALSNAQQEAVTVIHQSGEHLLTLLNDILDLSKIEAGRMELQTNIFHLPYFLKGIIEIFKLRAKQKGIIFTYEPVSGLPTNVRGDEKRLRQVLINLLGNAIKFTEQGSVTFKVGYHQKKVRFQVEDTGIGIEPACLEEIFSPFRQVGPQSNKAEGTGLGLAISQRLVNMMSGDLGVQSTPGQGSIFWVDVALPKVEIETQIIEPEKPAIVGFTGMKRRVLVVDDKPENRLVLIRMLTRWGFELEEATDGRYALHKAERFKPDVILMDIVMPEMDGLEATRRIRQSPSLREVTIIAISAGAFGEDRRRSLEAGCDEFLPKPVKLEDLLRALQTHLKLDWIYEQADTEPKEGTETLPPLVGPPPEWTNVLLNMAMKGDIKSIREQAAELEQLDPKYRPFATKLQQLAKRYRVKQIRRLLSPGVGEPQDGHGNG